MLSRGGWTMSVVPTSTERHQHSVSDLSKSWGRSAGVLLSRKLSGDRVKAERMKAQMFIAICSILFLVQHSGAEALECYVCNSYSDSRCADKEPSPTLIQKCDMISSGGTKYTMCRKTVQSIEFVVNGLPPEKRVIRTCGYDESNYKGRCYQRSGFGGRQEVCSCTTNHCNAATSIFKKAPHLILMLLCIIGSAIRTFVGN